jgi:hypothetical protein
MTPGLVQKIIPLPYDSALKYTIAKYYTPSGRCIQAVRYTGGRDVAAQDTALLREREERGNPATSGDPGSRGGDDNERGIKPRQNTDSGLDTLPGFTQETPGGPKPLSEKADLPAGTSAVASANSDRSVFMTLYKHRPVLDKGGVEPDLLLPVSQLGLSQNVFLSQGTFGAFAQVIFHPSPPRTLILACMQSCRHLPIGPGLFA